MKNLTYTLLLFTLLFTISTVAQENHFKIKTLYIDGIYNKPSCDAIQDRMIQNLSTLEVSQAIPANLFDVRTEYEYYCHKNCHHICKVKIMVPQGYKVSLTNGEKISGSNRQLACEQEVKSIESNTKILWASIMDDYWFFKRHCWLSSIVLQ